MDYNKNNNRNNNNNSNSKRKDKLGLIERISCNVYDLIFNHKGLKIDDDYEQIFVVLSTKLEYLFRIPLIVSCINVC